MTASTAFFDQLVRVQIETWNRVDDALHREHGIRGGTFQLMRVIAGHGQCRVNDIAEEMVITIGGASKLVDRLEAAGRCIRRSNPDDRRSSLIELTDDGRQLLVAASATFEAEMAVALEGKDVSALTSELSSLRTRS